VAIRFHRYCVPLEKSAAAYVERLLQHPAMVKWVAAGSTEPMVIKQEER
jgi:glutathione S-transferase